MSSTLTLVDRRNAIIRPSGENVGSVSPGIALGGAVIRCFQPVARVKRTMTDGPALDFISEVTRYRPSGDQSIRPGAVLSVISPIFLSPVPVTLITWIDRYPVPISRRNAICFPSGDHTGRDSPAWACVRRRGMSP